MNAQTLSPELALRIGMAARVLPDTDPRRLIQALATAVSLPITEAKLSQLTIQQLREADDSLAKSSLPDLKRAIDFLWGKAAVTVGENLQTEPYHDGDMPDSIRVAVASNSGENLDGHFGTCSRFLIYQVSPDELRLIAVRRTVETERKEDKNAARAALVADCHLLYVVSIGGPAAAKVVKADVHPVKIPDGGEARKILKETQMVLSASPPPWLAKVMGKKAEDRVRFEREFGE